MNDTHNPKNVARSGAIYTSALIIQKILSFTYFSLVARTLGPEDLGTYIFALSFAAFFSLVADFGFVPMAIRVFAQEEATQKENFKIFLSIRLITALLGIAILFSLALALGYSRELASFLIIASAIMTLDAFTAYFYTVLRARQNLFYESVGTVIFQLIVFSLGIYTISRTNDITSLLLVILAGSAFHLVYSALILSQKTDLDFGFNFNWREIRIWFVRAAPFFLAAGFIKAYNTIDTILIKNISGDAAVGLYAIPAKIVFTFPFIALAITAAVYPAMSNYAITSRERLESIFRRTLQLLLTLSLPIAIGISMLAAPIINKIWPQFSQAIPALRILIWAVVFLYIEFPFGSLLNATRHERQNTTNRGLQLLTFVVLNIILIPKFGFLGAVYASLVGSVLIVILGYWRAQKIITIFSRRLGMNLLKIFIASGLMGLLIAWLKPALSFLIIIPLAAAVYGLLLLLLRVYSRDDWQWVKSVVRHRYE